MSTRVQLTTVVAPRIVTMVQRAARQSDAKPAEYVRGAIVQRLRADGFDVAAALQAQD
jgi:hypothetical protein